MNLGDLVTLRLGETGTERQFLIGLIVDVCVGEKRRHYSVLAKSQIYDVTDNDLGPVDIAVTILENRKGA